MTKSLEEHADNWDLRHEDFKDNHLLLYDVYSIMRDKAPFAHLEFHIGLEQVLTRMPDYALTPGAEAVFHGNSVTRGFRQIPVTFSPGKRSVA